MRIEVGKISFLIEFDTPRMAGELSGLYKPFSTRKKPVFGIRVKNHAYRHMDKPDLTVRFKAGVYKLASEEFNISLNLQKRSAIIEIFSRWQAEACAHALNNIYQFLSLNKGNLVMHASAVAKNDRAYVFLGPSGSGKSTVAEASASHAVLSEELIGVLTQKRQMRAFSIPYQSDVRFTHRINKYFKIAGLFKLVKDGKNYLKPIPKPQALADFLILPYNFRKLISFGDYFDRYRKLIETVPCFELHFLPDKSFWRCIDGYFN